MLGLLGRVCERTPGAAGGLARGGVPPEGWLRRGAAPKPHQAAIAALAKLRNKFAHGDIDELTRQHVRPLADLFGEITGDDLRSRLGRSDPLLMLKLALIVGRIIIDASIEAADHRRTAIANALAEERRTRALRNAIRARVAQSAPEVEE